MSHGLKIKKEHSLCNKRSVPNHIPYYISYYIAYYIYSSLKLKRIGYKIYKVYRIDTEHYHAANSLQLQIPEYKKHQD